MIFTTITEIPISEEIFKPMNEEIDSSMNTLLIAGILLLIGLLLIVFCYIYRYSNHIIIPINKLKEEVEQIDRGNLYVKVQNNTQSKIDCHFCTIFSFIILTFLRALVRNRFVV